MYWFDNFMLRSSLLVWQYCESMVVRVHSAIRLVAWNQARNATRRAGGMSFM
jgi:hypothetical protein